MGMASKLCSSSILSEKEVKGETLTALGTMVELVYSTKYKILKISSIHSLSNGLSLYGKIYTSTSKSEFGFTGVRTRIAQRGRSRYTDTEELLYIFLLNEFDLSIFLVELHCVSSCCCCN